jgi:hypothetical protein
VDAYVNGEIGRLLGLKVVRQIRRSLEKLVDKGISERMDEREERELTSIYIQ